MYHVAILWPLMSLMGLLFSLPWIWALGESAFDISGFLSILLSSGALLHDPGNPVLCSFAHMADFSGTKSRLEIKGMSALSFDSGHDIGSGECVGTLGGSSPGIIIPQAPTLLLLSIFLT